MPVPARRPHLLDYVYTHNPFYAISASLMMYAVLQAYGTLEIGTINTWLMTGVLAAYTSVLALIGVFVVRWGKVWEDARSILLILLFLFLAVSVSADDLFVRLQSSKSGAGLLLCGYVFSAAVTELVLRGSRIRVGPGIRMPYHLMLALFYAAPWWCAPPYNGRTQQEVEWTLFLFSVVASVLFLFLLPAARRGPQSADDNGTPWRWPWFPWTPFVILWSAFALRSFALCLAFGPKGPIWKDPDLRRGIVFDTIWSPYFLAPLFLAGLVLLLEMKLADRARQKLDALLCSAPALLVLCLPWPGGPTSHRFLLTMTQTVGSPLFLASLMLLLFYLWAWLRRVPRAEWFAAGAILPLCFVGPGTIDTSTLLMGWPWPLLVAGAFLLVLGVRRRSSEMCAAAAAVAAVGLWLALGGIVVEPFRLGLSYHFLWLGLLIVGLAFSDLTAKVLRAVTAVQLPLAALAAILTREGMDFRFEWRLTYMVMLAIVSLLIVRIWRSPWYLYSFATTTMVAAYAISLSGFRSLVLTLGRASVTAFSWSVAALLLALLISAHKARWLPQIAYSLSLSRTRPTPAEPVFDESEQPADESTDYE